LVASTRLYAVACADCVVVAQLDVVVAVARKNNGGDGQLGVLLHVVVAVEADHKRVVNAWL
jgi:hypothetical protein